MVQAHAQELLNQKNAVEQKDVGSNDKLLMARDRLMNAFTHLEEKLQKIDTLAERDVKQHKQLVSFDRENEELREERKNLFTTISELEEQYDGLHKVAGTIYNKLDDSIKRLSKIIDG